ncbi:MAG TPA: EamA family transporter [Polyangia bacterium]|nr:EamA family transporter [Polyangia bacterium]
MAATDAPAPAGRSSLLIAFATLYLVWGSTYLAIRFAVAAIPPFAMAALRFGAAGGGLFLYLRARGVPAPNRRQWGGAAVVGALLLGGGNGMVCWAEQWVPSGETALIVATVPLWMTILPWRRGRAPHPAALLGVAIGLAGVATLVGGASGGTAAASNAVLGGRLALLLASLSWAVGSLWSRRLPLPAQPAMATALEMLTASPLLAVAALAHGEWRAFHPAAVTSRAWIALGYLIVAGSLAGFGSYVYLLKHTSAARASTYAFVNPLVAVVLGTLIAGEAVGPRTGIAALLIIGAVGAVVWGSGARRSAPSDLS